MSQSIFSFIFFFIRYSGIAQLVRYFIARNRVSIVLYHNPTPDIFETHINYLSQKYALISMSELCKAIDSKNFKSIPKYALVVTLDDGWKENYDLLNTIRKYKFRPTIFLTSHLINTERHFWWTTIDEKEIEKLKKLPNKERIRALNELHLTDPKIEFIGDRQALNINEIEKMKAYVDFGLHTCYHPILTKCTSEEKRKEIIECKKKVEAIVGHQIESFSYPNGDYDDECIDILQECGIKVARTTNSGWNSKKSNPYKLKVTGISDHSSKSKLIAELTGISMYMQHVLSGSFNGMKN